MDRIRVLVVDDSAFARKVLREVLPRARDIEVVGFARDGLEALEKIGELKPDVITLDLVMPNLDGIGVLAALPRPGPRAVIVSMAGADSAIAIAALQAGAVSLVHKPTALATDRLYEMAGELIAAIREAARARQPEPVQAGAPARLAAAPRSPSDGIVVIGASTGGPQALTRILTALPESMPAPVALVLHLPAGYTAPFAERLDRECALSVEEASDGAVLKPGKVLIARAGLHLRLRRRGGEVVASLDAMPSDAQHRPSVNVLFESAAQIYGASALGVVLTGMGDDGLEGARALRAAGGRVLTEAEATCVVYGMPRAVAEAGLSTASVRLEGMAAAILSTL